MHNELVHIVNWVLINKLETLGPVTRAPRKPPCTLSFSHTQVILTNQSSEQNLLKVELILFEKAGVTNLLAYFVRDMSARYDDIPSIFVLQDLNSNLTIMNSCLKILTLCA